jgi:ferredoxin, 2Fe-2S
VVLENYDRCVHRVRFQPSAIEVEVPAGTTLLDAALAAGLPIARSCGADGVCAKCGLVIVDGAEHLSPEASDEARIKQRNRVDAQMRLACRARIHGDVTATAHYW